MTQVQVLDAARQGAGGYKVDVGTRRTRVVGMVFPPGR